MFSHVNQLTLLLTAKVTAILRLYANHDLFILLSLKPVTSSAEVCATEMRETQPLPSKGPRARRGERPANKSMPTVCEVPGGGSEGYIQGRGSQRKFLGAVAL